MRLHNFPNFGHFQNGRQNTEKNRQLSVTSSCYCHILLYIILNKLYFFLSISLSAVRIEFVGLY